LRSYVLHALFVPPALVPDGAFDGAATPARNPFPFFHKPDTLDRDPWWESWEKIAVIRDGFDTKA
jgi:dynein light intermediate chain 1